jgi:ABC-type transport system involved in Fe-S cluster assembly fused permease/ATPase subunit
MCRAMTRTLVDAEKLLDSELLNGSTDINDKPGAPDLVVSDGDRIRYVLFLLPFGDRLSTVSDNVSFTYDGRQPALRGVSFRVPMGRSVALVGESGAGKSTILRLLYRFYDLKDSEGSILVDGQDIRDVTQASLRKAIGVVPQDAILFNASLAYNVGYVRLYFRSGTVAYGVDADGCLSYAKFRASREEVEESAKAA